MAIFGQLTQVAAFDLIAAIAEELAPRICAWVGAMDDLSGVDAGQEDWLSTSALRARSRAP